MKKKHINLFVSKCSKNLFFIIIGFLALFQAQQLNAQVKAPGIQWYNSYWADEDLCDYEEENEELNKYNSGEDWFYSNIVGKNTNGTDKEIVAVGYQGYRVRNVLKSNELPCQLEAAAADKCLLRDANYTANLFRYKEATIWFLDLNGFTKDYVEPNRGKYSAVNNYNYESAEFRNVIQTNDGNYVASGSIQLTDKDLTSDPSAIPPVPRLKYNPTSQQIVAI